jgi:hypothetical protein
MEEEGGGMGVVSRAKNCCSSLMMMLTQISELFDEAKDH